MFKKKTTEKAYSGQEVVENIQKKNEEASGLKVLAREFAKDRGALGALILLIILFLGIFIGALFLNTDKVMTVDIFKQYNHPGADGMLLGGDEGGRDVFKMLILGARNSLLIGIAITVLIEVIGTVFGLVAGYYGGKVDNIMMRFLDFMMVLPTLMIIIVIVVRFNHVGFLLGRNGTFDSVQGIVRIKKRLYQCFKDFGQQRFEDYFKRAVAKSEFHHHR